MTDAEAIKAVRDGMRCETSHTLHGFDKPPEREADCIHRWRTVACDFETDVIECSRCGDQRLAKCDFEEEYS